jgi:hypothetical protein
MEQACFRDSRMVQPMILNTRRRMLGLIAASLGASRLLPASPAFAAKGECFALKSFGDWKGVATNTQAGARISQIAFSNPDGCDLRGEIQVATSYDTALVVYGSPDTTRLPKDFLVETANRLIVRDDAGNVVIDVPLCGVCNEIRDDKVTIILPLATAPLFREKPSVEIAVKLGDKEECRFDVNCEDLRAALDWAAKRKEGLARDFDVKKCTPPGEGCFLTTACCEALGLPDDCFELEALRRYRDLVLAASPQGREDIALYYRLAPAILAALPEAERRHRLLSLYLRFILPSALAARFGLNRLAYRLYASMMNGLVRELLGARRSPSATLLPKAQASPH